MLLERHELTEVVAGTETKPEKVDSIYFIPYYQQKGLKKMYQYYVQLLELIPPTW